MLKFIIVLVVIIAVGVGGAQFYITYKVDKFLEQMSSYAAMTGADFSYKDVQTTYDGAVEVKGVSIDFPIPKENEKFSSTTDLVRVKFPSLLDIIQLGYKNMKELPASVQLQVEGTRSSPLDNDLLNRQLTPNAAYKYPFYMKATEMGLDEIVADFSVGYLHDAFTAGVNFDIDYNVRGLGSYNINLKVKNISSLEPRALMMQDPQLQLLTFNYNDETYNKLWVKNCQEKNKITADQCISDELDRFNKRLSRDFQLSFSDKFESEMTKYMKNSGSVKISIDLSEGSKSLMQAMELAEDPLELLVYQNVILSINGEYIQPIFKPLSEEEIAESKEAIKQAIKQSDKPIKKKERKKIVLKVYDDYKQYIGKKVLLITDKRKQYVGTVLDVKPEGIKIKVRLEKGDTFTYRLSYDRIKYAEVYQAEPLYR
ncbi:hypothetical protein H0A36_12325 [Endozoicomonas sp. SM1973]|uniref:Uncharacterized protein n=1 Tax=Spartinivicinus marinus TaxID=2994442 RepID=A0A853I823_9GAMM|nr:hypothetical protein [Spartinivicinus marinus]MCX4026856.1 hypothetical protein [Spartinivicinus marinus]NYZ66798.1 hypothetical protein [Spartinivicinus marinus]